MQFLLVAHDGKDPDALTRRLNARPEHLEGIATLKKNNAFLFGGAILDDDGKMVGSMVLYDFPDRAALNEMLKDEPYITGGVWKEIKIMPFRLASIE
jgi:uncharacterized protein